MSTGGAFFYPLAQDLPPDGYLGWGTSSTGLACLYRKATQGDFSGPYARTALRLRERGKDDFTPYTKELDPATRDQWWQQAQDRGRASRGDGACRAQVPSAARAGHATLPVSAGQHRVGGQPVAALHRRWLVRPLTLEPLTCTTCTPNPIPHKLRKPRKPRKPRAPHTLV